jgi:type I restriction enzyme S subunit
MNVETFFEKFEMLADAPDAVGKMRALVLHLAFHGSLVPQSAKDEPASTLLNRSRAQMTEMMEKGRAKREKPAAPITKEDAPFSVPAGWTWCRLVDAGQFTNGVAFKPSEWGSVGRPIIRIQNLSGRNPEYNRTTGKFNSDVLVQDGDILVSWSATLDAFVWRGEEAVLNQHIFRVLPAPLADKTFLYWLLKWVIRQLAESDHAHGLVMSHINRGPFLAHPIPLPPLAEQKRIVAKVDELMALCDRLEAQQAERKARHTPLTRAALARFAESPTPANLEYLFHPSYDVAPAELRQSILSLAVQGTLVPQEPTDEPAAELLAKVERDRARLAKESGVRLPKNVPPLTADHYPHDVPDTWKWSRIGHLALVIDYGTSQKADGDSAKVPVYRMGNIAGGRLVDEHLKYVDSTIDDLPGLYLKTNDILFNRTNSYELVGKAGIYTGLDDVATFASYLIRIRLPGTLLFPPFYSIAMNAPYYRRTQIEPEIVQQCGQANFNGTKLAATVVPVPPLAEQRRIVAKVNQLMALVDQLEAQRAAAHDTGERLMNAIVAELTSAG